jgi:putative ABC transport system permease protein
MEKGAKEALVAIGGLEKVRRTQNVPIDQRHHGPAVGITINDVLALKESAPLVRDFRRRCASGVVSGNGKSFRAWSLSGVWPVAVEMSEHVVEHGRMFNELDDEMARNVCVIGTETRNELWGSPERTGREVIPIGETVYINSVPFTIVGMFQHYESEQDRKAREFAKLEAAKHKQKDVVARDRGRSRSGRQRGGDVFRFKNSTIYIPLNTMWMKFRTGAVPTYGYGRGGSSSSTSSSGSSGVAPAPTGDLRLSTYCEDRQRGRVTGSVAASPQCADEHAPGNRRLQLSHTRGLGRKHQHLHLCGLAAG